MSKKIKCMADGGIVGADGMTEAQRAKRNAALSSLGMSTAPAPVQPAQAAPLPQAPVQQPPVQTQDRPRGIFGIVGGRQQQIDKAAGYAQGGLIRDAAEYWADDNARFDNSNPSFAGRVIRAVNPLTGFGSAMGAMHTAAGNGDIPGMAMAGISAIPAFGVMRITPASGALKAAAVPSAGRAAGAVSGGAVLNAIADEYQANKPSGYANGGKIEGPGTPTSDSIPAKVKETGEEIRVSNGERIVSAEQGALLEALARKSGFESLDALLEAGTGKPVGPTIKGGKRAAADGMSPEEKEWRLKTGNLMSEYPGKPSEYNAAASRMLPPVFPDGFGAKVNPDAPPVGLDKVVSGIAGMFSDAARASNTAETKSYEQLRAERAGTQQQAQPVGKPSDLPGASYSNEGRSVPVPITTAQSPTSQSRQVSNERGIITADTASASMSSPMTRRGGIAGSYDGKGVNDILERENKARAGMIDSMIAANGGNGVGIVGQEATDATARDNAEKTRRWRNDELVSLATRGNQGAIASLINAEGGRGVAEMGNETQRRNAELAAQVANNRDKLTMRGQDLNAQNELARLLGNPLDQQSKQLELKKQGIISGLFDKANSGDTEALAKYNALVNGGKEPNYSNRYITLPNRKTYNDMGQITGEEPGGVFDAKTGQLANFGKQGTGVNIEEANKIKAAVASGAMKREDAIKKLQAMGLQ